MSSEVLYFPLLIRLSFPAFDRYASLISYHVLINFATANFIAYLPYITIRSDGSIEPETGLINRAGNTYTVTSDISREYAVVVQCSDVVLDGAGHTINGSVSIPG